MDNIGTTIGMWVGICVSIAIIGFFWKIVIEVRKVGVIQRELTTTIKKLDGSVSGLGYKLERIDKRLERNESKLSEIIEKVIRTEKAVDLFHFRTDIEGIKTKKGKTSKANAKRFIEHEKTRDEEEKESELND